MNCNQKLMHPMKADNYLAMIFIHMYTGVHIKEEAACPS
jgi:hypothetical protein